MERRQLNMKEREELSALLFPSVSETPEQVEAKFPARRLKEGAVVSRMAPSPTGFVHLGNLVQGLTSERMCHQSEGVLFLRVEDTDAKREVPGAIETLIETLLRGIPAITVLTASVKEKIFIMFLQKSFCWTALHIPAFARKRS